MLYGSVQAEQQKHWQDLQRIAELKLGWQSMLQEAVSAFKVGAAFHLHPVPGVFMCWFLCASMREAWIWHIPHLQWVVLLHATTFTADKEVQLMAAAGRLQYSEESLVATSVYLHSPCTGPPALALPK